MIVILTYDAPHRKTQDLLMRLLANGHSDLSVIATPWEERKNHKPMISHRPGEANWPAPPLPLTPTKFAQNLSLPYKVVDKSDLASAIEGAEMALVGGAGILPRNVIEATSVVNAHPAWIPYGRGLDSLKWCIYRDLPIGVTTHIIDEHTDAGWIIEQRYVSIYEGDTFHALAHRQYEIEMDMLVGAIEKVREMGKFPRAPFDPNDEAFPVTRRMPAIREMIMLRRFEARLARIGD
jgi:phosphoribosylglycinamide formyltransferase-1